MASRSLYAFENPNGRIGTTISASTNNAAISATLVGTTANTSFIQNLATLTALPVGLYSVLVSIPLTNTTAAAFIIENWIVGASTANNIAPSLGSSSIVGFPTTCAADAASSVVQIEFLLNNTSATTPIFINSVITIGATANSQLSFGTITATTPANLVVATKMA
jgi:hypothetical protein